MFGIDSKRARDMVGKRVKKWEEGWGEGKGVEEIEERVGFVRKSLMSSVNPSATGRVEKWAGGANFSPHFVEPLLRKSSCEATFIEEISYYSYPFRSSSHPLILYNSLHAFTFFFLFLYSSTANMLRSLLCALDSMRDKYLS